MRETLHIRLREPGDAGPIAYAITRVEPPVSVFVHEGVLDDALAQAEGKRIVLYAPGQDVRLLTATVPVKQAAKAALAVPYALEEQFAEDVETLHFAVSPQPLAAQEWAVAVVAHSHLREWLAPFTARGLNPEALIPETLALPWRDDGRWTVLAEPGRVDVRSGPYAGFGCLADDFELFLSLAEGEQKAALRILVASGVTADFTRLERDIELLPGLEHPLAAFARHHRSGSSINLLQGPYAPKTGYSREWQAFKPAMALLAGCLLLGVLGNALAAYRLGRDATQQEQANEARFVQLFPDQRVVKGRLREQVEQQFAQLGGSGSGGGLLPLLDALASGLKAAPSLQVQALQFRDGALFLSLTGSDLAALDQLRGHFSSAGGARLDVQSANSGEGGLQIRIKLSPA